MEGLKALLEKKRKAAAEEFGGKKYVKRSEIEDARLKKLRDEENEENKHKELRRKVLADQEAAGRKRKGEEEEQVPESPRDSLSREEVIRRLRLLQQPATLFGEDDGSRAIRLRLAAASLTFDDDSAGGGQQGNTLLALQKEQKAKGKAPPPPAAHAPRGGDQDNGEDRAQQELMATFQRAAEAVKQRQGVNDMEVEDRILMYLRTWCDDWRADLDARQPEVAQSGPGQQARLLFDQTMTFFQPLFRRLTQRELGAEIKAGLWLMVGAIRDRNYLQASDIYMKMSIGTAPWPIGVTSIGIHDRSAREKISHSMNVKGTSHIMTDEATRKYLQAMKRLMTTCQRLYPTDPSRSVDFSAPLDPTKGASGGGSDKAALLEAERTGATWRTLGLPAAPHYLETDGSVKVPDKWENILMHSEVFQLEEERVAKARPRTPPTRSPLQGEKKGS